MGWLPERLAQGKERAGEMTEGDGFKDPWGVPRWAGPPIGGCHVQATVGYAEESVEVVRRVCLPKLTS